MALAGKAGRVEKAAAGGKAGTGERAGMAADTAGREDMMAGMAETVGKVDRAVLAVCRGGMDLVLEDLDDPTSNRRPAAGTVACSNSSNLYYGIRRSNSCLLGRTAAGGSSHCSRNIHLALAWNRILSWLAVSSI